MNGYDNTWYDAVGNIIKSQPAGSGDAFIKTAYDGADRPTATYTGYYSGGTTDNPYATNMDLANNKIFVQAGATYDAGGNITETAVLSRYHNDTASGTLDAGVDARPQYEATWYDGIGRMIAAAAYGNQNDDTQTFTRPTSPPDASDTILVGTTAYNSGGKVSSTIDPAGVENRFEYDNVGREIRSIENYQEDSAGAADDANVTLETNYNADGYVATLTAKNPDTGDQTTNYEYGVVEMSGSNVIIATNDFLHTVTMPDSSDGSDRITTTYNRQGGKTTITDQNGSVRSFDYDKLGRQTQDRVTTVGSGVDSAVRRIAVTYEVRGLLETVTSRSTTSGSSDELNQVKYVYNYFEQLATEYQEHVGVVGSESLKVQYGYEPGTANTIRPTALTYPQKDAPPNGRVLTFDYGSSTEKNYKLSRVETLDWDTTDVSSYTYLGLETIVNEEYVESGVDVELDYIDAAKEYNGFDRFGRVINQNWRDTGTEAAVDQFLYGYDRASNRTYRENTVATVIDLDELYGYDNLQRLTAANRGQLEASKDRITGHVLAQTWQLDPTGNWKSFSNFDQGTAANDLVQQRTTNAANEITDVTETVGDQWITPAHDRSGNMTTMPRPDDPTSEYDCTYGNRSRVARTR